MKEWFTASELASAKLPAMPHSKKRVIEKAKRESWEAQQRMGRGGGFEYHISNLPFEARRALESRMAGELLTRAVEPAQQLAPAVKAFGSLPLTEAQRSAADARVTIINSIRGLEAQGITQQAAMTTLLTHAEVGQLAISNPALDKALRMTKDRRGRGGNSPYPSLRSLKRYLYTDVKQLAPKKRQPDPVPVWANDFLMRWQRPEKPSINAAHAEMVANWQGEGKPPSIDSVRRFLKKMGNIAKNQGRMGARELKNILPFTRRDFSKLLPADIYSADGHTFDGEVQHPLHGRPFRPEVTTWIDIATRRVVGVSVALAESGIAVLDAFMDACGKAVPAINYVDNGSGYCNAMLKDEATGVMARLGTTMTHSIPYNSQARGVVERVHQTLWVSGAKTLPGYMGADMDQQARQSQFKMSRKAIREGGTMHLMGFPEFMEWVHARVDWYNSRPHSTLPKVTDATGKRRHATPDEQWQMFVDQGWQPVMLTGDEAAQIFRPRVTRKVRRGEIELFANRYFSNELTEWHGEEVHVAYDLNNANHIWIFEPEHDRLICRAEWNANRTDYYPVPFVEQAREKRFEGRLRRKEAQIQEIEEERRGQPLLEHDNSMSLGALGTINGELIRAQSRSLHQPVEEEILPLSRFESMTPDQRYTLYQEYASGARPIDSDAKDWVERYPRSAEYRSKKRREEDFDDWGPAVAAR